MPKPKKRTLAEEQAAFKASKAKRAAAKPKPKPPTTSQKAAVRRDAITKKVAPSGFQRLLKALGLN